MSRPDAARERWKDTKRSALGRAEGHHTGLRLPGRLSCFYGTLRGEAEKPEEEMSPPPGAPVAEGQKKRISRGRAEPLPSVPRGGGIHAERSAGIPPPLDAL